MKQPTDISLPVDYNQCSTNMRRLVREQYVRQQDGKCHHCGESLETSIGPPATIDRRLFPLGFFQNLVHLHHNHDTGMTIGAVHARCNAILWQYHGE